MAAVYVARAFSHWSTAMCNSDTWAYAAGRRNFFVSYARTGPRRYAYTDRKMCLLVDFR